MQYPISSGSIGYYEGVQGSLMLYTAQVIRWNPSAQDSEGAIVPDWEDGEVFACGYNPESSTEVEVEGETVVTTGTLRVPASMEGKLKSRDRVKLLTRARKPLIRQPVFDLIGEPKPGIGALTLRLREVQL